MPFQSQAQARAAFGGYLGSEMKDKASQWASETPGKLSDLPMHVDQKATQRKAILAKLHTMKGPGQ